MEKENKYYDLIEQLIRKHKKFSGLEAILDDIIDDVYSHSEVILKTVNNESVINAYLEKVVSTSIITVPKRMDFHSEVHHAEIKIESIMPKAAPKVDNSLVEMMLNGSSATIADVQSNTFETVEEVMAPLEISEDLGSFSEPTEDDANFADEILTETIESSDENSTIDLGNNTDMTEEVDVIDENDNIEVIDEDSVKDIQQDSIDTIDLDIDVEPEFPEQLLEAEEIITSQNDDSLTIDNDTEQNTELTLEDNDNSENVTGIYESEPELLSEELIDNEVVSDENSDELLAESDDELLINDDDTEQKEVHYTELETDLELFGEEAENTEEPEPHFVPTDYSVFCFNPQNEESGIDTETITKDLTELSDKYPDLSILDIYNLKYKENLSVSEVAKNLNISENKVIEALNEIIAVI